MRPNVDFLDKLEHILWPKMEMLRICTAKHLAMFWRLKHAILRIEVECLCAGNRNDWIMNIKLPFKSCIQIELQFQSNWSSVFAPKTSLERVQVLFDHFVHVPFGFMKIAFTESLTLSSQLDDETIHIPNEQTWQILFICHLSALQI